MPRWWRKSTLSQGLKGAVERHVDRFAFRKEGLKYEG